MTESLGTDGGQVADEVTGLTAAAEEVVAARPERRSVPCPAMPMAPAAKTRGFVAVRGRA